MSFPELLECVATPVIYKATVVHKNKEKFKIGSTERQFKAKIYEHTQSFRSEIKNKNARLNRLIHKTKNDNIYRKK